MEYLFSDKLSKLEMRISKVLLENVDELEDLTITDISNLAYVSPATITKYTKKLGFNGYKELKYRLIQDHNKQEIKENYILSQKNKIDIFFEYLDIEKLKHLASKITSSEYVCMYGEGFSLDICNYFADKIKSVCNIPVVVYDDFRLLNIEISKGTNNTVIVLSTPKELQKELYKYKEKELKNIYFIFEEIHKLDNIKDSNQINLTNLVSPKSYFILEDKTLFYLYFELLLKTLEKM